MGPFRTADCHAPRRFWRHGCAGRVGRVSFGAAPCVLALALLAAGPAVAQQAALPAIPAPLAPWVPWVLADAPDFGCAVRDQASLCRWPGELQLELTARGGEFRQVVQLDRDLHYTLPGGTGRYPERVMVDGKLAPVVTQHGHPAVWLTAGEHRLSGRFLWATLPERLSVPHHTGLVALSLDGQPVPFPRRDGGGQLWLRASKDAKSEGDALAVTVFRRIEDGIPMRLNTFLRLRVSGRAREVNLGQVLLGGSVPISVQSKLPVRLEPTGELRVQVRAGTHEVEVHARFQGNRDGLELGPRGAPMPEREVWVWRADETLRQVELSGATAVDPARTELPAAWKDLPAFALKPGASLFLKTQRRGEPTPPPNQLKVEREMWLDLDGSGFTVRDTVDAKLTSAARLDLLEGELGHVSRRRPNREDLLITRAPAAKGAGEAADDAGAEGHTGVELRMQDQQLVAEWRYPGSASNLPAVAWSHDVQRLSTSLHLGPGYRLLAATGVDDVDRTWLTDWDLFDLFFVLLISIAVARMWGPPVGAVALLTLVLCHQEADAPQLSWLWLIILTAVLRVVPEGRLHRAVFALRWLTVLGLVLIAIPFAVEQARTALFVQLDGGARGASSSAFDLTLSKEGPSTPPSPTSSPPVAQFDRAEEAEAVEEDAPAPLEDVLVPTSSGGGAASSGAVPAPKKSLGDDYGWRGRRAMMQDPEAVVQTGPGVPTWRWQTRRLTWSGPVDRGHRVSLWLLTPPLTRFVSVLRIAFVAGLLLLLLRRGGLSRSGPTSASGDGSRPGAPAGEAGTQAAAAPPAASRRRALAILSLLACPLLALCLPGVSHAQGQGVAAAQAAPPQALLDELRKRLTAPHKCHPNACLSLATLRVEAEPNRLVLTGEVHAQAPTALRLPGPTETWVPARVRLDGKPATIARQDGFLMVRLSPGVHLLQAEGPLPGTENLTLAIPDRPERAEVIGDGWTIDGLRADGSLEGALSLSRELDNSKDAATLEAAALPPWLALTRTVELGPSWTVSTELRRVSPDGQPLVVRVPRLPTESVTESHVEQEGDEVIVRLPRGQDRVRWSSTLKPSDALSLTAAKGRPYSERWTIACGPIWHCELRGIAPLQRMVGGTYKPEIAPWPGETLGVRVQRPEAAPGQSTTVDRAELSVRPGVRILDGELLLTVRSSRGGAQTIGLPAGAKVQALRVRGRPRPLRQEGGEVRVTLEPGEQRVELEFQQPLERALATHVPAVTLGGAAVNATVEVQVPRDRWLLWVSGPTWGPAVLFWPYLLLVVLIGVALGRIGRNPLSSLQWVLLLLGLTQVPAPAALVVVGWFFALHRRGQGAPERRLFHNLGQLGLLFWTFVAMGCLYAAVHAGLLTQPDMQVEGPGSSRSLLRFYVDRFAGSLPTPVIYSAPMWLYRVLMLAWSLWLAASLVRWMPWAFEQFRKDGLWRSPQPPPAAAAAEPGLVATPIRVTPKAAPQPVPSPVPPPKPERDDD